MTADQPDLFDPAGFAPLYQLPGAQTKVPEIIGIFLDEAENLLHQARAALDAGDLSRLARAAHGLRGSSSLAGANRLRSESERLEAAADSSLLDELAPRLERVAATLGETRPLLLAALEHPPVT